MEVSSYRNEEVNPNVEKSPRRFIIEAILLRVVP
jgi:hypothetical protein